MDDKLFQIAVVVLQLLLAGFGALGMFILKGVKQKAESTEASLHSLAVNMGRIHLELVEKFVTKAEFTVIDTKVHDLHGRVAGIEAVVRNGE